MKITINELKPCNQLQGLATPGYLWAFLSEIGTGYSVANGLNSGYCGDLVGLVEDNPLYGPVTYQAKLWSSLDPGAPKQTGSYPIPWNKINYLINMYPLPNPNYTWLEIQAAIWELVHGCNPVGPLFDCPPLIEAPDYFPYGTSGGPPYGCQPDGIVNISEVNQIVSDTNAKGENFIPGPGEKIAVVIQILSCSGNTVPGACDPPYQIVFVTAQCPTPGITVAKSCTDASVFGQPINFSAVITNTGNETLNNITCSDDKAGTLIVPTPSLAPGASTTVTGSYVPTTSPSTNTLTCTGTGEISNLSVSNSSSATCKVPPWANCVAITAVQGNLITPVTMTASGGVGGPYTFSATGLPTGLTMSSSGTISGTPTVSGTFYYTVTIKDSAGNIGTVNCSVTVNPVKPGITIVKTADKQTVLLGEKVTYTYKITNIGNLDLTNIKVVDNNGTPTYASDDFTVGTIALLEPGASQTFTSTRVPPAPMCGGFSSGGCGLLVTEHRNDGKTKFTFLQSKDGRDNYWTFNNWYGSRAYSHKAKIRVYDKSGNTSHEVYSTLGSGDGSRYFNSFSCLADKSIVVKSDGCSVNLPDIFYKKGWNKDWHLDWDQSRGDYYRYHYWDDDYEGYNVSWDYWEHPDTCSGTSTNTATVTASWSGGMISATDDATVNLTAKVPAKVSITKTANKYQAAPGEAVTYTYVITNTGGISLTNLVVVDDNGTPTITEDDFTVGTVALLDPSKSVTMTKTLVPAAPVCGGSSGCGLMITQHLNNGTTRFTFLQSKDERNTYWTFSGWEGRRSYAHWSKMRVYDKTGWTYRDFDSAPSTGVGNYFNSFSTVVNTSLLVKSDGCSVNLPTVFYKKGWNNDWHYDWDKWGGDYNRTHYWDDDYWGHYLGWDYYNYPYYCSGTVTNTAKVTATGGTITVTASDDVTVKIVK